MHTHLDNSNKITVENYKVLHNPDKWLTIFAYNQNHEQISDLANARRDDKGIEAFNKAIEKAKLVNAAYVVVYELSSKNAPIVRPSAKYQIMIEQPTVEQSEPIQQKEFKVPDYSDETFRGLGGLGELMNVKENLYKKEFELQSTSFQLKEALAKIKDLETEVKDLDKENDELEQGNQKLLDEVERLQKYEPKGATVMGFDVVSLGSAILERGVKVLAKNNPKTAKGLLGLDDEGYKTMLQELDGKTERNYEIDKTQTDNAQFEDDETTGLSEQEQKHLQVAKQIYEWLKKIPSAALFKVATVLEIFQKDISKADECINQLNNTQDNDN